MSSRSNLSPLLWLTHFLSPALFSDALARSPSRLANRNLLVELVGSLVNLRFLTFSDRFLRELRAGIDAGVGTGTGASAKSEREAECRLEMIIRAMGGFKLKVRVFIFLCL